MSPLIMQQTLAMGGLTLVELLWVEKRVETWIRFGQIAKEQIIDPKRQLPQQQARVGFRL